MMSRRATILSIAFVGLTGCIEAEDVTRGDDAMAPRAGSHFSDECRVQLDDSFNLFTTIFDVESDKHADVLFFSVYDEDQDWTVEAAFDGRNSPIETDAGVPDSTLNEIRKRFKSEIKAFMDHDVVHVGTQLTYTLLPGAKCTRDEFGLIHFLVMEWFYFG